MAFLREVKFAWPNVLLPHCSFEDASNASAAAHCVFPVEEKVRFFAEADAGWGCA